MALSTETDLEQGTLDIQGHNVDVLLEKEWLLTNRRGSYASGTVIGCNTRRYHGLLVASMRPPVERVVTLSNILESVSVGGTKSCELANFEFSDKLHPQGYQRLKTFRRGDGVHFYYDLGDNITIEKSIYLSYEHDLVLINYDINGCRSDVQFQITPMVTLRDFHGLQSSSAPLGVQQDDGVVTVHGVDSRGPAVHLFCRGGEFTQDMDWWYAMHYRRDRERGQQHSEDVWACGSYNVSFQGDRRVTLVAQATQGWQRPGPMDFDIDDLMQARRNRRRELVLLADTQDEDEEALVMAADQFIVNRHLGEETAKDSATILAGYHWFADWGRDTFIALPGLLLHTGRHGEAKDVLVTFARVVDKGQIPNRFDDYNGPPHYNSVDASLWFVNAAYQYLQVTDDRKTYDEILYPKLAEIVRYYQEGTRDQIHADSDGLILAGDSDTQLTWMDARCNGVSFTPRYGKAVEINALWVNALNILAETTLDETEAETYLNMAKKVQRSFMELFWNEANQCLNDCVYPDGGVDQGIRPNQIFAVSLPFSSLKKKQQKSVVETVREHLLTPFGLRSLSPRDSRYQGHYGGEQFQRDGAYHQGTVWAFLMGPFIEAYLKANNFTKKAKTQAAQIVEPLLEHLQQSGCLGSINEIFDGDWPHEPKGCIAQAWSVAELLRCKKLLNS